MSQSSSENNCTTRDILNWMQKLLHLIKAGQNIERDVFEQETGKLFPAIVSGCHNTLIVRPSVGLSRKLYAMWSGPNSFAQHSLQRESKDEIDWLPRLIGPPPTQSNTHQGIRLSSCASCPLPFRPVSNSHNFCASVASVDQVIRLICTQPLRTIKAHSYHWALDLWLWLCSFHWTQNCGIMCIILNTGWNIDNIELFARCQN